MHSRSHQSWQNVPQTEWPPFPSDFSTDGVYPPIPEFTVQPVSSSPSPLSPGPHKVLELEDDITITRKVVRNVRNVLRLVPFLRNPNP